MVDIEVLRSAIDGRISGLRKELLYNRRILNNVEEWGNAIDKYVEAVKKHFDLIGEPECVVENDPSTSQPYVCIQADAKSSSFQDVRARWKACHLYAGQIEEVKKYSELIILDINRVEEGLVDE